ncbi:hypothetical protein [Sinorhizobium meliloti]|uniref:hypothetical protein n=1 Tax=Rhizobium meliloti TaxID=382 RepID=UPI003F139FA9
MKDDLRSFRDGHPKIDPFGVGVRGRGMALLSPIQSFPATLRNDRFAPLGHRGDLCLRPKADIAVTA